MNQLKLLSERSTGVATWQRVFDTFRTRSLFLHVFGQYLISAYAAPRMRPCGFENSILDIKATESTVFQCVARRAENPLATLLTPSSHFAETRSRGTCLNLPVGHSFYSPRKTPSRQAYPSRCEEAPQDPFSHVSHFIVQFTECLTC